MHRSVDRETVRGPRSSFYRPGPPQVFAHRGGCDLGPENTLAAFDLGVAAGADGLELDVHLSADGVVVVHHDTTLDRTTGGAGPIAARTADELARIDAGARFERDGRFPFRGQGIGIPTLREVLRRYELPTIIEMKADSVDLGERVVDEVRRADAVDRVCVAGFGSTAVRAARSALPGLASSACTPEVRWALYRSWVGLPVRHTAYGGYQVPEFAGRTRVVSPRFVTHAHGADLRVQVWTVDEEADMERLLRWGVDALISNRPDLAVRVRDRFLTGA